MVVELLHRPHLQHLPPSKIFPPPPPKKPQISLFLFLAKPCDLGPEKHPEGAKSRINLKYTVLASIQGAGSNGCGMDEPLWSPFFCHFGDNNI